jgi:hypothetical protein
MAVLKREGTFFGVSIQYLLVVNLFLSSIVLGAIGLVPAAAFLLASTALGWLVLSGMGAQFDGNVLEYRSSRISKTQRIALSDIVGLHLKAPPIWANGQAKVLHVTCRSKGDVVVVALGVPGPRHFRSSECGPIVEAISTASGKPIEKTSGT